MTIRGQGSPRPRARPAGQAADAPAGAHATLGHRRRPHRMNAYERWITAHVRGNVRGRCAAWTRRMQQTFPELRRVGGFVARADRPPAAGVPQVRAHWWLVTPAGQGVDPP